MRALKKFYFGAVLIVLLVSAGIVFGQELVATKDGATSATVVSVHFQSSAKLQVEVWLDGKRLGFTPFSQNLTAGPHYLTAIAEAYEPIMQDFSVGKRGGQVAILPAIPLSADGIPSVVRTLIRTIESRPANPHFTIIGLHVSPNPDDLETLFQRADAQLPGDAIVAVLRSRRLMKDGKLAEAVVLSEKALSMIPRVAYAWRVRAEVLLASGDVAGALDAANEAVVIEPENYRNVQVRAKIQEQAGNQNAARNDTDRADKLYDAMVDALKALSAPVSAKP